MSTISAAAPTVPNHSISNLTYRIYEGNVDLTPLLILESRETIWLGYRVSFHVLGASHAVVIEGDEGALAETLTCGPIESQSKTLFERSANRFVEVSATCGRLQVIMRSTQFQLNCGWPLTAPFQGLHSLRVEFPVAGLPPAETAVCWHNDGPRLKVETIHTYPEEGLGIHTHSIFEALHATAR